MRFVIGLVLLGSCVPPQPTPSYYGQPAQGQPQGYAANGQQAPSGLSCTALFTCFQGCTDGTCIQSCVGQADAQTQAAASALMQCGADRCQNVGGDCLVNQCSAELNTCRGPDAVAYTPEAQGQAQPVAEQMVEGQPHTTADLLPWMTGQWVGTNHQFEFWADGRVRRASGVPMYSKRTGDYACVSVVNEIGTVRQEGDLLIMEFAPADSNHCGDKDTAAAGLTVRYRITWYKYSTLPTNLLLVDIDCTRGAMYCNDQMRRR